MKLQNKLEHMREMAVLCNGTRYEIDERGVAEVEDEDDAKKLLSSSNWKVYREPADEKAPKAKKTKTKPETKKQAPPETPEDEESQEADEAAEQPDEPEGEGDGGAAEDEAPEGDDEPEGEEGAEDDASEWPDPDVSMKKDYLQAMADAYEVEYEEKTTKAELVELIKAKMYE